MRLDWLSSCQTLCARSVCRRSQRRLVSMYLHVLLCISTVLCPVPCAPVSCSTVSLSALAKSDTLGYAGDAFQLAKTAFTKATKSVSDAAGRLIPRGEDPQEQARWRDDDRRLNQDPLSRSRPQSRSPYSRGSELYRPEDDSFLGGLMGRTGSSILLPD